MFGYIVYAEKYGIRFRVVGYTTRELAEDFVNRWQGAKGMRLIIIEERQY